jgi:hypothetical protein
VAGSTCFRVGAAELVAKPPQQEPLSAPPIRPRDAGRQSVQRRDTRPDRTQSAPRRPGGDVRHRNGNLTYWRAACHPPVAPASVRRPARVHPRDPDRIRRPHRAPDQQSRSILDQTSHGPPSCWVTWIAGPVQQSQPAVEKEPIVLLPPGQPPPDRARVATLAEVIGGGSSARCSATIKTPGQRQSTIHPMVEQRPGA